MIVDMRLLSIPVMPITDLSEVRALVSMIEAGGIPPAIVIDKKFRILEGKMRYLAHKQLSCGGIAVRQTL